MYRAIVLKSKITFPSYIFAPQRALIRLVCCLLLWSIKGHRSHVKNTEHEKFSGEEEGYVWQGAGDTWLLGTLALVLNTDWKYQPFIVACTERVHCACALGVMIVAAQSFAKKLCSCASIAFLAGIISYSVNNEHGALFGWQLQGKK